MKKLFLYFLILFILLFAIWLGLKIQADPGYVLIAYDTFTVETTFWLAIFFLLFCFFFLYVLLRAFSNSKILPQRLRLWWRNYQENQAIKTTNIGLVKFVAGSWHQAEKCFIRAAKFYPNPLLNYLQAAYMAEKQAAFERREKYLDRAAEETKEHKFTIDIIRAHLQIKSGQYDKALVTLANIEAVNFYSKSVFRLLIELYSTQKDWLALLELLPKVRSVRALTKEEYNSLELKVYLELLQQKINDHRDNFAAIRSFWLDLPKYLQKTPDLLFFYLTSMPDTLTAEAESILQRVLNKSWHPKLLKLYANLSSENPSKQLVKAEKWLCSHPNDADLLICLGRLCKRQKLWARGRFYLEKSVALMPNSQAYLELGDIMLAQNDMQLALDYYRKGLRLTVF